MEKWVNKSSNLSNYVEASRILKSILAAERFEPTSEFSTALFGDISRVIQNNQQRRKTKARMFVITGLSAAALLIFFTTWWFYTSLITYTTGNNEILTVELPDHSIVRLNSNSSLSYRRAWKWIGQREVHTTGEAYFEVVKSRKSSSHGKPNSFRSYSGGVVVEVLGTKYNVRNRAGIVQIALIEGAIKVKNIRNVNDLEQILKAGETIQYDGEFLRKHTYNKETVKKAKTWISKNYVFENLSVDELIKEYSYIYGKHIVLSDSLLLNRLIDGKVSLKTEQSLIYSLANILAADVRISKDTIYLDIKDE